MWGSRSAVQMMERNQDLKQIHTKARVALMSAVGFLVQSCGIFSTDEEKHSVGMLDFAFVNCWAKSRICYYFQIIDFFNSLSTGCGCLCFN